REAISTVQNEFTSRGQSLTIAPAAPKRAPVAAPPPPPPVARVAEEELSLEIEAPVEQELEMPPLAAEEEISFEEEAPAAIEELTFEPSKELTLGEEPVSEEPFFGV